MNTARPSGRRPTPAPPPAMLSIVTVARCALTKATSGHRASRLQDLLEAVPARNSQPPREAEHAAHRVADSFLPRAVLLQGRRVAGRRPDDCPTPALDVGRDS